MSRNELIRYQFATEGELNSPFHHFPEKTHLLTFLRSMVTVPEQTLEFKVNNPALTEKSRQRKTKEHT